MAQTQRAGGYVPDPAVGGAAVPDSPEAWGTGGTVGNGRYRLTRRLGRGGMAEVFAAEDVRLGRVVAVKLLRADLAEDPVAKARFTREAQAVAGLNHHAVVAVYDSGEDGSGRETVPFIVMEYVEGRTIRELLTEPVAPGVDEALTIVSGVLEALAYSHAHGIVHRDIKPANVIITTTGAVKVMDFGIARALHGASTTMTQTGMVMGTPQYLSPEQALGRAVDARSDLYATGCLLYELLALRPPFTGETPLSVVYQHVQDDPRLPSEVNDRVPPELDGLVLRALAKEPDDRYQSAEEMHGEIQYALRMLGELGSHTGEWGTGHNATGEAWNTQQTAAWAQPQDAAATSKIRTTSALGPAPYPPRNRGSSGPPGRRRRWRNAVLLAVAAVLAATIGSYAALHNSTSGPDTNHNEKQPTSQSSTQGSTDQPTNSETDTGRSPTDWPSSTSSGYPTDQPSDQPTDTYPPTNAPTGRPTNGPTTPPTQEPTDEPTSQPTEPAETGGGPTDGGGVGSGGG